MSSRRPRNRSRSKSPRRKSRSPNRGRVSRRVKFSFPDEIKNLDEQIKYMNNLNREIIDSLVFYAGRGYAVLNYAMRNPAEIAKLPETYLTHIRNIDWAFAHAPPLKSELIVYRGIREPNQIENTSWSSTSLTIKYVHSYAGEGCCILKITVPAGNKVLPMFVLSDYTEEEILLDRGAKFTTVGKEIIDYDGKKMVIYDLLYSK